MMTNQPKYQSKPAGSLKTTWRLRKYDVWGNSKDGYEVNGSWDAGEVELRIPQTRHNIRLAMVTYRCRDIGYGVESGNCWGEWGETDSAGKREFRKTDGTVLYLFPDEVLKDESGEFISAYPSDRQIKQVFGVRCRIDTEGDDLTIYVNRQRDGYPLGEMHCESHESLSPVRKAEEGK